MPRVSAVPGSTDLSLTRRSGLQVTGSSSLLLSELGKDKRELRQKDSGWALFEIYFLAWIATSITQGPFALSQALATHNLVDIGFDGAGILLGAASLPVYARIIDRNRMKQEDIYKEMYAINSFVTNNPQQA